MLRRTVPVREETRLVREILRPQSVSDTGEGKERREHNPEGTSDLHVVVVMWLA